MAARMLAGGRALKAGGAGARARAQAGVAVAGAPIARRASSSKAAAAAPAATATQPFHHAIPVHDLEIARRFYGGVLGLSDGRSSKKWHDYSLYGHQLVVHLVHPSYRCTDHFNPVDGDEVPVPHFGVCLSVSEFHALAKRLEEQQVVFIIKPHIRFQGQPGEQWTMFFKDPSGNNLEFKAMTNPNNLFAKYTVD